MFQIKLSEPYTEQKVTSTIGGKTLTLGIKVYSYSETQKLGKEFDELKDIKTIIRLSQSLQDFLENKNISPEESSANEDELIRLTKEGDEKQTEWLKEQVLYIKNFSFPLQDEEGKITTFTVKDSREATSLGSLWNTPEECLAVLLGALLEEPIFREPTLKAIREGVFRAEIKAAEAKNSKK